MAAQAVRGSEGNNMRIAIAGVGVAGGWFSAIVREQPEAQLVGALRSAGGYTTEIEQAWGVPCFTDWNQLLSVQPEALIVASTSGMHFAQAKAALEQGLHVLVEKPMTLQVNEARQLVALARQKNLRLGVVYQRRSDPVYSAIKKAIDAGALGQPVLLSITMPYYRSADYYASAEWRGTWALDGGGVLMNQGIHLVDVAVWWLGRAQQVSAFAATQVHTIEVEDTLALSAVMASGALVSIAATTASQPGATHTLELCGTLGSLRIEGEQVTRWDVQGWPRPESSEVFGSASDPKQTSQTGHLRLVRDFIEAIQQRRDPLVSGEEGIKSLELVQAAYLSAREARVVQL